jgi:hypothetical protein
MIEVRTTTMISNDRPPDAAVGDVDHSSTAPTPEDAGEQGSPAATSFGFHA